MESNFKLILGALALPLAYLLLAIIIPAIDYALFKPLVDALSNVPWWAFFMFNHSTTWLYAHAPSVFWTVWGVCAVVFYAIVIVVLFLAFKYGKD
ncbi:MAG TPA: hypothetical protein VKK79_11785 [Candidatus Lokiarchaeia archaeon]|nr:hypothetical protein [Candidatus Lokiarchaeia archaeon]